MTPTLAGRWQSRFLLLGTLGMMISIGFAWLFESAAPLILLLVVALFGLAWDVLYDALQKRRWDHDWPPTFQLLSGIIEGLFVFLLVVLVGKGMPLPYRQPLPYRRCPNFGCITQQCGWQPLPLLKVSCGSFFLAGVFMAESGFRKSESISAFQPVSWSAKKCCLLKLIAKG